MARREITDIQSPSVGTRREVVETAAQNSPLMDIINLLTFGLPSGAQKSIKRQEEGTIKRQKQAETDPIGAALQSINPMNFLNEVVGPIAGPTAATAGVYYGAPQLIKALWPYMSYGGVNQLKDKIVEKSPNLVQGKDLQASLTKDLTAGNKLGNIADDVESIVNDLLTRRMGTQEMPASFSNNNVFNMGDLNRFAKNVGQFEQGYQSGTPGNVVRTSVTSLIKNAVPEAKVPYMVSSALSKLPETYPLLGKVPFVGNTISPRDPWTWIPAAVTAIATGKGVANKFFPNKNE